MILRILSNMRNLDSIDRAILDCLQQDGRMSNNDIAERVNLSPAPCWRRTRRLEKAGVLRGYVALVDAHALGLDVTAFISISLNNHHARTLERFDAFVAVSPEVMECYSVSGEHDYILRVVASGIAEVEEFIMHRLLRQKGVHSANTTFVLGQKKSTTALPLA